MTEGSYYLEYVKLLMEILPLTRIFHQVSSRVESDA